ncbi:proteasome subunit beta [Nanoarchaeota archaeon NZ13-N]|uniref:Proteasome subunit beta n=1 Tax=Candidatus Nanoclepta minutus TaxID=1940235 RepID=A0A397WS95_9ARCH|nr:MAG: proteasome subunit beta [Nanoarchaeota archaeon NZ13-N]RIB35526.1 MAG: hypothetical protein BXU00_00240 [Candidatus Nanoclepta minutus]
MEKKTGTTVVAIKFKNGVVVASDKRASAGALMVIDKATKKIYEITDSIVMGTAGLVADAQMLAKILSAEVKLKELRSKIKVTAEEAANLLSRIMYSYKYFPFYTEIIIAGKDGNDFSIYMIDELGGLTKHDDFIATGSGMMYALGVLESSYKKDLDKDEAKELAKKAVLSAIERDLGTGEGIDVYVVTEEGIEKETYKIEKRIEKPE